MPTLTYLIGVPGSGKTTLMTLATAGLPVAQVRTPIPHLVYGDGEAVQPGVARERFGGTDALSMNVMPKAVEWVRTTPAPYIVGEGDRLASPRFFAAAEEAGYTLAVVYLVCPDGLADRRRRERGSRQDPRWLKGRATKVQRLADRYAAHTLDCAEHPTTLARRLRELPGFTPWRTANVG